MRRTSVLPRSVYVVSPLIVSLVALLACAPPLRLQIPTQSRVAGAPGTGDAVGLATDSITVQVRYFSHSSSVSVLAWRVADPGYGLRGEVWNDGSLVGDHVIYVSTSYQPAMPLSPRATIPSRPLEASSGFRDEHACYFGECSPFVTVGAVIPDHVLREARDNMPVRFYEHAADHRRGYPLLAPPEAQGGPRELTITVDPVLIAAYLAMVDSVSSELRKLR
jgi:hypothetical protein